MPRVRRLLLVSTSLTAPVSSRAASSTSAPDDPADRTGASTTDATDVETDRNRRRGGLDSLAALHGDTP